MSVHSEKAYTGAEVTAAEIRELKFRLGTIIKVPHKLGYGEVEFQKYQIIGVYPDYVLCVRRTANGGTYTKCFLKSELFFNTIEAEDEDDR